VTVELQDSIRVRAGARSARPTCSPPSGARTRRPCACSCARPRGPRRAPQQRLTAEGIRAERLASLARRDPVLGAAIAALDLDLLD
jgi:hypothetical protein